MASLGRSSTLIAAGTLLSRLTGLLRTMVLVAVIGSAGSKAGDAFASANQLPNNIYMLLSTGILSAVIVPQIVRASKAQDGGRAFIAKLFTLATTILLVVTALAMLAAPVLVWLYAGRFTSEQQALATAFAYWCLPQILFYGLYALAGETLNARGVFGPFAWAPVINNVVSIAGFGVIIALFGSKLELVDEWTPTMIAALGGTATLGIAAQAGVLGLFWRKLGIQLKPDFRWRGIGLRHIGRLAGWTFLMLLVTQLAAMQQGRVVSGASGSGPGTFDFQNAWLIFMVPFSVIAMAIGTPYYTRMSSHASDGRHDEVRKDIGTAVRSLGFFMIAATAALVAAAVPAARLFTNGAHQADHVSHVLVAFLVCLVPMSVLFVLQRTFYAYNDTRTPFFFTVAQATLVVVFAHTADALLPPEHLTSGVALGQALATTIQAVIAGFLLRRKIGAYGIGHALLALLRFALAAVPAGFAGWGVYLWSGGVDSWMLDNLFLAVLGGGGVAVTVVAVYLGILAVFRTPELKIASGLVRRVLKR